VALRPTSARWFEIVVPEGDVDDAMEALARRGQVQFEWAGEPNAADRMQSLAEPIARYRALAAAHARYWPPPVFERRCCTLPVDISAQAAMRQIERWLGAAAPCLERVAELHDRRRVMSGWGVLLPALAKQSPTLDLGALTAAGPVLAGVCVLPAEGADAVPGAAADSVPQLQAALLELPVVLDGSQARLGVIPATDRDRLCERVVAQGGECLPIPAWFSGTADEVAATLPCRLRETEAELARLEEQLRGLAIARGLDRAAGVLERIDWFRDTASNIRCDEGVCWITGWTSTADAEVMDRALADVGVNARVAFPAPPRDAASPSVLTQPRWLAPFDVFTRAVGVPTVTEADPTTWVALMVPLLFGYMCGDVGHGAVIALIGLLLRRRTRLWPLLVVCGIAAMGFGAIFGDVFGYGHIIEPLWVHPLDAPLQVLAAPLLFGALVLTLGLLLHLVQSCWRGQGRSEGVADAAQLLIYWGALLAVVDPRALWLMPAGALLCLGNRLWVQRDPRVLVAGLGHLLEATFSLLLNTLSFARVGAFALAHAALETTVVTIAADVPGTAATVLIVVLGNLFVIVLEGLVVSIQTSRLVMFEFFVRFFEGGGRRFEPAASPPRGLRSAHQPAMGGNSSAMSSALKAGRTSAPR